MKPIDVYSYRCGVIDCFNEMVRAGLKKIALSHPTDTKEERDQLIGFSEKICQQYGNRFYIEDQPLLTDLFPVSMNRGKYNIIYYRDPADLAEYLSIKADKERLLQSGTYISQERLSIAKRYGKLLSYSDEGILRLIEQNNEKE
ncbi:MAG: hypothetical protein IKK98_03050 [Oscillospiraceae bacterium]|nr:hypothetical protein [Oscillospiraceae bacterium]MBR2636126.1 hypothetical protein [Oscillospiraceae bacterium]MBR6607625.1 hypothetical protein [Oscillospiraceae bacterium]